MTELEKKLTAENQELKEQIHVLTEKVDYLTKVIFGRSSEKTKVAPGQLKCKNCALLLYYYFLFE